MATVLVVDDDVPILDLLSELLEECGHTTLRATNGKDALTIAQLHHPHIIITDIMMPEMNGYDLLKTIRTTPKIADTAVILVSAGVSRLGASTPPFMADGYMQKPFNLAQIEQVLNGIIIRQQQQPTFEQHLP